MQTLLMFGTITYGFFQKSDPITIGIKILRAVGRPKGVKTTGKHQILQCLFIGRTQVDALGHVNHRLVFGTGTMLDNGGHGTTTYALHSTHAKTDGALIVDRKFMKGFVHIGPQNSQSHATTFLHEKSHLLDITHVVRKYCCHILGGIVRFEVGGLVTNPSVTGRV